LLRALSRLRIEEENVRSTFVRQLPLAGTLLLVLTLLLAACGGGTTGETGGSTPTESVLEEPTESVLEEPPTVGSEETGNATGLPEVYPAAVEGDIIVAGSSTVYPLTEAVAESFYDEGYGYEVSIDSIGSGAGFERFCVSAETDISNASRAINEEETAACAENGREALEFRVGTDALAIVVNPENDWVTDLTLEQLAQIYAGVGQSGEGITWADVDPSWPAEEIELYSPGTDSGTFDYFVEAVYDEDDSQILSAPRIQFSEDDNVLVQGVSGSPNGIGYFGYAYYLENADTLKIINVEGVEPNADTAESGEYPLARPLFIYSAASVITEKPQVGAFINYYLTNVNDVIDEVGYFPASDDALNSARDTLRAALGDG
jgi:phosphate transport system substrate-binding protein